MMELRIYKEPLGNKTILHLEIPDYLLMKYCKPDEFTQALMRECDKSGRISDKLLAMEHIVRDIEKNFEEEKIDGNDKM